MIKYLFSIKLLILMYVKEEDKPCESMKNHIRYYKSLSKIILNIQEADQDADPTKRDYPDNRIDAIEKG